MRDLDDLFEALRKSSFRRRFSLTGADLDYLNQKGLQTVLMHGREFLLKRLAPAAPIRDGKQTPWRGHPVFVAQHATASCCRGCLFKWHHIAKGKPLDDAQMDYLLKVIERWLTDQQKNTAATSSEPSFHQQSLFGD